MRFSLALILCGAAFGESCPSEITPIKPVTELGSRDAVRSCICDSNGRSCRWQWLLVKDKPGFDGASAFDGTTWGLNKPKSIDDVNELADQSRARRLEAEKQALQNELLRRQIAALPMPEPKEAGTRTPPTTFSIL